MTDLRTNLVMAFDTMRNHRLRTALTVLGLTMGVAVLIMVITLILGANTYVEDKIANLGTNVFRIGKMPFTSTSRDEYRRAIRAPISAWPTLRASRPAARFAPTWGRMLRAE